MKVTLSAAPAAALGVDALAIPVAAEHPLSAAALELDRTLGGVISEMLATREFRGELHEFASFPTQKKIAARRVILYGLGRQAESDGQRMRSAHQGLIRAARTHRFQTVAVLGGDPLDAPTLKPVVEGCVMGTFERATRSTGEAERGDISELHLLGFGADRQREVSESQANGDATNAARAWQNAPPNEFIPESLAQEAARIAERHHLDLEVLGPDELRAGGYNLLLGVASGSARPPRLITLRHRAGTRIGAASGSGSPVLALVGKGITFDTGGISLKPAEHMSRMKADMAGAAAVLAAIDVIAARQLPIDVIAVVASAENMPGPAAQRPGDVLVSADGKTVEIVNTDAEGRLVLADALTHALRCGATHILDLATLTGAATIAIGHASTAAVSNDDAFWSLVSAASIEAGDRVWRLPILAEYRILLRSKIADLRNSEYGEAGAILGGMFIGEFAGAKPWAHLDIAASSWNTNLELTTVLGGPSGAGTRICIELAELMARAER